MSLISDPITGLVGLLLQRAVDSKIGRRAELLLEVFIATQIAFLATCGSFLAIGNPVPISVGSGMCAAALALLWTFNASPNSKGMTIAFPAKIAADAINTPSTTERKNP